MSRFYARSVSDKTDDCPIWFVADLDRGGLNVTADLVRKHVNSNHSGGVLTTRDSAIWLADLTNSAEGGQ